MNTDIDIVLHALGLNEHHDRKKSPTRNHYVTGPTDDAMDRLVAAGLMEQTRTPGFLADGDRNFRATDKGRAAAIEEWKRRYPPPSKRVARAKGRYDDWLRCSDCWDITFGEYLRRKLYKESGA